ncbi:MAG: hypothetical protein JNM06_15065 [Blastocatellia bacterium]|nr:hypothetical protein [Blastocatellia bacterium]
MKYFLISEATRYVNERGLAYSAEAIRHHVKKGKLPAMQTVGNTRIISEEALNQFIIDKQKTRKQEKAA